MNTVVHSKKLLIAPLMLLLFPSVTWADCKKNDFDKAVKKGSIGAYQEFLRKCTSGDLASQARQRLQELEEERDWPAVAAQNNPTAFTTFLEKYPATRYLDQALRGTNAAEVDQKAIDFLLAENMLRSASQNPRTAVYVGALSWINELPDAEFKRLATAVTTGEPPLTISLVDASVQVTYLAGGDQLEELLYKRGSRLTTSARKPRLIFDGSKWWKLP